MIAKIRTYDAGPNKGYMIEFQLDNGSIVERITATEIVIEGEPWPVYRLLGENRVELVRGEK